MKPSTSSRRGVLDRLNSQSVDVPPLPDPDASKLIQFDDPFERFKESLALVGGEVHEIEHPSQATSILNRIEAFSSAQRVASVLPAAVKSTVDLAMVDDPHSLASLDWMVASGEFMIAENGAIWVDGSTLPHRVLIFIAQFLAIVVPRDAIVHNMHEAYDRIGAPKPGFGVFVSGPSKTADIEQSLVLGAHGCRKLQVFVTS
ncbi:LutC/YkgG family protein [Planctomycetes bacterium K23_9]|uniref:Lactate utilization protein C n=1 Tax=Stieleria marina TaxID=1930275 RepID=A0A517NTY0_9BACT|nr:Lactate utilization protein C [Planctomycetes bacterium K23_9]